MLRAHGYRAGKRCTQDERPARALPRAVAAGPLQRAPAPDQGQVRRLLDAVPPYFSQGVVSRRPQDRQPGLRHPADAARPPEGGGRRHRAPARPARGRRGRRGRPAGAGGRGERRAVLAVAPGAHAAGRAGRACSSCCCAVRRSLREAAVPLIPIALATGWSGGVLFVLGLLPGPLEVDLNPMSVTLGALVIAISTEFSVLLSSRYRQEREAGAGPGARDRADLRLHRRGGAGLGRHRDRRLRRADRLGHPHAARLRHRHGGGPDRLAARA